ncbi:M48 family metallopeptidase [Pseudophaeobacter arcticus]|uniref:M48 family metallopeptidase n=1 Tax=Pseudophaeobacter arcticus TaxID=385492 RepID=UPI0024919834|nr:M48 family metallopeptidase [Pseudophaeobacter arcticus]
MNDGQDLRIQGRAFAPGSSAFVEAEMTVTKDKVFLIDPHTNQLLAQSARNLVKLDNPVGTGPRNSHFPDHWMFQTFDPQISTTLQEPLSNRLLRHFEIFSPRLGLVIAVTLAACFAVWKWGLPVLVALAVWMTPNGVLRQIDASSLASLDRFMASDSQLSKEQRTAQQAVLNQLLPHVDLPDREIQLTFRKIANAGPNALALPGGTIVLTDELVSKFAKDPNLIAGVLAHEIGHVAESHSLKQLYHSLSVYLLIALLAGDVGPILDSLALEGQTIVNLSFSRHHELQADTYALHLISKAGYSKEGLRRFFEAIKTHDGSSDWLSSHPLSRDRIRNIDSFKEHLAQ